MIHAPLLIVPGINGSDSRHWQSIWERSRPDSVRFQPSDWNHPLLSDWLVAFEAAVAMCSDPPIIVAHSLGCILVASWAERAISGHQVRGAFLVAPPDPHNDNFPAEAPSFRFGSHKPLGFPCVVIAAANDPYCEVEMARRFASTLEAGFVCVGAYAHINSESSVGAWKQGRDLLECFSAGLSVHI